MYPVWNYAMSPEMMVPKQEVRDWYTETIPTLSGTVAAWLQNVYTSALRLWLTTGGTVKLVVLGSDFKVPSDTLIDEVQTAIDPNQNHGEGLGIAPIGHVVNVFGADAASINLGLNITYKAGWNWDAAKAEIEAAIDDYFLELSAQWMNSEALVIRVSQIEQRVLDCSGVMDVYDTEINGNKSNLTLGVDDVPIRGDIVG